MNFWIFLLLLPLALGELKVCTQTANMFLAGTDDNVFIQLSCSDKQSQWIPLKHTNRNDFERGNFDCFVLGDIYNEYEQCLDQIGIKTSAKGWISLDLGWNVDFVSVCFNDVCKKVPFGVVLSRSTTVQRKVKDAYICTKTSEDKLSGTDGNAFGKVFTSGGESDWIPLHREGNLIMEMAMLDCFNMGNKLDKLQITNADDITKLGLKLQGSGKLDEWKVDYASVYINGACKKFFFNKWINQENSESSEPC